MQPQVSEKDVGPSSFTLPDIAAVLSSFDFSLAHAPINPHHALVSKESADWFSTFPVTPRDRSAFETCNATLCTTRCYPHAEHNLVRVANDWMIWTFYIDDVTDELDAEATMRLARDILRVLEGQTIETESDVIALEMTKDWWQRMLATSTPDAAWPRRHVLTIKKWFKVAVQVAAARKAGVLPDIETYLTWRRVTSGSAPCFTLIEYVYALNLPDYVMEHPSMKDLEDAAADFISITNDLCSYAKEDRENDMHNVLAILTHLHHLDLQSAVDRAEVLLRQTLHRFRLAQADFAFFLEFTSTIDAETLRQIKIYTDGLEDWIVGSTQWTFETERYFGKNGREMLNGHGVVHLAKAC